MYMCMYMYITKKNKTKKIENIIHSSNKNTIDGYPWSCIDIVGSARKRCGETGFLVQSKLTQDSYRPATSEFFLFEPIQIGKLLSRPIS